MARKQLAVACTTAFKELVSANPRRTGLLLQNRVDATFIISISKTRVIGMHVVFSTAGILFLLAACLSLWVGLKGTSK